MYTAKIQNASGEILTLNDKESKWVVLSIDGLHPAPATVNMTRIAGVDGSFYNGRRIENKNIVVMLQLAGDVEANRMELYRFFRVGDECRFFYKTERRDVFIDGIIESFDGGFFTNAETFQISIICPSAFFSGTEEKNVELGNVQALFEFPFAINRNEPVPFSIVEEGRTSVIDLEGDADAGFVLRIRFPETGSHSFKVGNATTGEFIADPLSIYAAGDEVLIDTRSGSKKFVIIRDGEELSGFLELESGSTLFQLHPGENRIEYAIDNEVNSSAGVVTLAYRDQFKGV